MRGFKLTQNMFWEKTSIVTKVVILVLVIDFIYHLVLHAEGKPSIDNQNIEKTMDNIVINGLFEQRWSENDPLLKMRTILISGKINELVSKSTVGKLLYLNHLNPNEEIDLYLRTTGGWLADAYAIIDTMSEISAKVNVHALGACPRTKKLLQIP